jgi:anti-sigma28 factor (negative regulator of flagellin synthesis)
MARPNVQSASIRVQPALHNADIQPEMKRPPLTGEGSHDMKVTDIQEQVGRGEYQVDERAVAEAILRRILGERRSQSASQSSPSN